MTLKEKSSLKVNGWELIKSALLLRSRSLNWKLPCRNEPTLQVLSIR